MSHSKVDYDKTETNSKGMLVFLLLLVLFLLLSGVGVLYMTSVVEDNVYIDKVSTFDRPYAVEGLRAYESDLLNNYGVVDKEKGLYRIPMDKAIDQVVKEYQ